MPTDPDNVAADLAAIRETLAGIGLDDTASGDAADAVRRALAQHGRHLDAIGDAARAVAQAANDRATLVATRDAETPTDDEIRAAQEAVILAASAAADGTGSPDDVRAATDRLSDLLAQKKDAQEKFSTGEATSAQNLDNATTDLPANPASSPLSAASVLPTLLSTLSQLRPPTAPMTGSPTAGDAPTAPVGVPEDSVDPDVASLLDSLQPGPDGNSSGPSGLTDPNFAPGAGQTHTSADELPPQMPTLSGAQTAADVSGRPANPFTVAPASGSPALGAGAPEAGGGMPMAPMAPMAPMGGSGVSSGKGKGEKTIIRRDPDLTGADIDADIATSGIVGRGERHR